jgi:hypothetical protein
MKHPVVKFFRWLKKEKQVRRILKVVVRDNHSRPCCDEVLEASLEEFDVHYLDWNRTDLRAKTVEDVMPNVRELWLYSSGNDAVLRGWADAGGLGRLKKVSVPSAWHDMNVEERFQKD